MPPPEDDLAFLRKSWNQLWHAAATEASRAGKMPVTLLTQGGAAIRLVPVSLPKDVVGQNRGKKH